MAAVDDLLTRGDAFLLRGALTTVDGPGGVFLSRGRRLSKVFLDGEVVAGSGPILAAAPISLGPRSVLFAGSFSTIDMEGTALFQRSRRTTRRLLAVGDAMLGGRVTDIAPSAGPRGTAIAAVGLGDGAEARAALLRVGR